MVAALAGAATEALREREKMGEGAGEGEGAIAFAHRGVFAVVLSLPALLCHKLDLNMD